MNCLKKRKKNYGNGLPLETRIIATYIFFLFMTVRDITAFDVGGRDV